MITTRQPSTASSEAKIAETNTEAVPSAALPKFPQMAGVCSIASALPVGLLLILGKIWLAVSVALGAGISLGICGLLFLFIERVMPQFFQTTRSRGGAASAQGAQLQFLLLLSAKLAFIALVGAAFLTLHQIQPVAVLVGFVLGQSAIVLSVIRFRKPS